MKTAFCLSIGPFWGKRFLRKNLGLFIIFGLLANFFNLLSNNFLRGFQSCLLCFHQIVSKKNHLFLKKNSKFFHHFRILSKQFLYLCHKIFVKFVKTGFYVSKGPFWSKRFSFWKLFNFGNKLVPWTTRLPFFVENFSAGLSELYFMILLEHSEKKKFSEKSFLYLFWTLVKELLVSYRKKNRRIIKNAIYVSLGPV